MYTHEGVRAIELRFPWCACYESLSLPDEVRELGNIFFFSVCEGSVAKGDLRER
jgi:hypothetical protein